MKVPNANIDHNFLRVVEANFVTSAAHIKDCPPATLPEITIAGRSNVGKSSLINMLCSRKQLAKTSGTPGKTQLINYFHLRIEPGNILIHLVDLPGYGFAKAGLKQQQEWGKIIGEFVENRKGLKGILHLLDSRHKPTALDCDMREWINFKGIPAITVLTKTDKLSKTQLENSRNLITSTLEIPGGEPVIYTSVLKKSGSIELCQAIVDLVLMPSD